MLSTTTLSNLKTYLTGIPDKKLEMSTFKLFSALKQEKKTLQYLDLNKWKSIRQEYRQCSFIKFKNFVKISYYTVTIDELLYKKYLAVTSFAILLTLNC